MRLRAAHIHTRSNWIEFREKGSVIPLASAMSVGVVVAMYD